MCKPTAVSRSVGCAPEHIATTGCVPAQRVRLPGPLTLRGSRAHADCRGLRAAASLRRALSRPCRVRVRVRRRALSRPCRVRVR
eukprot:scaffold64060_cov69-Phaeocystis_antarctica.AAC.1